MRLKRRTFDNSNAATILRGNRGGFSFEIETLIERPVKGAFPAVATGAASRLRLKHRLMRPVPGPLLVATGAASRLRLKQLQVGKWYPICRGGNRGGFSFEIETARVWRLTTASLRVATGAASRLRLKHADCRMAAHRSACGNRGGFSFEIETTIPGIHCQPIQCGNRGGFSFEIETSK